MRRALVVVLLASGTFVAFAFVSTQVNGVRAASPWQDDPYDMVVSGTMFFVPVLAALCLVRAAACRLDAPSAVQRLPGLVRAMWLVVWLICLTVAVDWTGVLLGAHRADWTWATGGLVGLLLATTATNVLATIGVRAEARRLPVGSQSAPPDWAEDVLALAGRALGSPGSSRPVVERSVVALRGLVEGPHGVRRHPLRWAAGLATAFGLAMGATASQEEGLSAVLTLFVGIGACSMFAFLVIAGSFLGLVTSVEPLMGFRRRIVDAIVLACASAPVVGGFRDSLWWLVRSSGETAGLGDLWVLIATAAAGVFLSVSVAETVLGVHARGPAAVP